MNVLERVRIRAKTHCALHMMLMFIYHTHTKLSAKTHTMIIKKNNL